MINRGRLFDAGWILLLALYVLGGVHLTPFHADESTTIWMSKDYHTIFYEGDLDRIRYQTDPAYPDEQHLRLLTGMLVRYTIGFSWTTAGFDLADINQQWDWGQGWEWNIVNGHAPTSDLLMAGRWPSALMLACSVALVFVIGQMAGNRPVAYLASGYYALNPAILLNGRRAMFEGGLLLFVLLAVVGALYLLKTQRWRWAGVLGVAGGLALSAKYTALFPLIGVYGGLMAFGLWRRDSRTLQQVFMAGLLTGGVVFLLQPIWWGNTIQRAGQVYEARSELLAQQTELYGGYTDFTDQTAGLLRQVLIAEPQYFEVVTWINYIGEIITEYEATIWPGVSIGGSTLGAVVLVLCILVGGAALLRHPEPAIRWVLLSWAGWTALTLWLLTPVEWQRYYLVLYPIAGLLGAVGLVEIVRWGMVKLSPSPPVTLPQDQQSVG